MAEDQSVARTFAPSLAAGRLKPPQPAATSRKRSPGTNLARLSASLANQTSVCVTNSS